MGMAALTQVSRWTVEEPERYGVQWLPIYLLSVAMLLGVGAKKILSAPRSRASEDDDAVDKIKAT